METSSDYTYMEDSIQIYFDQVVWGAITNTTRVRCFAPAVMESIHFRINLQKSFHKSPLLIKLAEWESLVLK